MTLENPHPTSTATETAASGIEGHPFKAVADLAELNEKFVPGPHWSGRTNTLSRSQLALQSRRMCQPGRTIIAAIHRVDSGPMPLVGTVARCEYAGEGQHLLVLDLIPLPDSAAMNHWLADRARELARMA
jgi:hypothetical protein